MANTVFKLRRSSVAGKVPNTSTLSIGELGINLTDKILYSSDGSSVFEIGANITSLSVTNSLTLNNDKNLYFKTVNTSAGVIFKQQSDDNFVMYSTNTSYGQRPVWSIFANSITSAFSFSVPTQFNNWVNLNSQTVYANGSSGSAGQVLASNGSATYWVSPGVASVNTSAQYTWTNTHTFQANVSFTGSGLAVNSNTGSVYFGGISDANWRISRNAGVTTKYFYTNNTLDIIAASSPGEGIVFGWTGNSYLETGYAGTFTRLPIYVGNSSVNTTINATSFTGTANNSLYLGGTAAASYVQNTDSRTLSGNLTYTGANLVILGTNTYITSNVLINGVASFKSINGQSNASGGNFINNAYATLGGAGGNYLAFGQQTNFSQWIQSGYSAASPVYYDIIINPLGGNTGIGNTLPNHKLSVNGSTYFQGQVTFTQGITDSTGVQGNPGNILTSNGSGNVYWSSTANNATNLNAQPASYYTNATNINTGTLPYAQLGNNVVNTTSAFTFSGVHTYNANIVLGSSGLSANGSYGSAGEILHSNGSSVYWATDDQGVTSVITGSGLTGGPITSNGTVSVLANNGITANTTGLFVTQGTGTIVNSSGVHVNSTYIGTLSSNSATYLGNSSGTIANVSSWITTNASAAYTNSVSYTDSKIATANSAITGNAATAYTNSVAYTDSKILTANAAITGNAATAYTNSVSYVDNLKLDSVTNTSITLIPVANTVKNAYDRAIDANTRAASAQSAATSAYSNAVSYVDSKILTANAAITGNAATAYTNAIAFASNASNINTGTLAEARLPYRLNQNLTTSNNVTFGSLTLTGNLTVSGNVTVIGANALSIVDNMIYLNSNNTTQNIDVGVVANYNSGAYAHTGIFRDASDGYWKVFDSYLPEPDANVNIDTTNTSFHLADFQANSFYAGNTSTNWFIANTTGAYHTGLVNAASYRVGTSTIANATGVYTGVVNGSSITVGTAFTANATVVNAVSYYAGSTLIGNTTGPYGKTEGNLNVNNALTSNNSSFLGGTAAASYQLNSTLNANIASYLPTYTGVVNGSSHTVGTSFTANSTVVNAVSYYAGTTLIGNTTGPYGKTEINLNVNSALTSNNSSFLGGTAAASYQLNSTLNANIASYLPTYTGVVNGSSHTVGTSFTANSTMTNTVSLVVSTNTATIGNGTYFVSNGNVGIGNSVPVDKLSVAGGAYFNGTVSLGTAITAANATVGGISTRYDFPDTSATPQYVYLGRWSSAPQSGSKLKMSIIASAGYNAAINQNQRSEVFFKLSNASSFQSGSSGNFFGDGTLTKFSSGGQGSSPSAIRVVQIDNNTYDFYGNFSSYSGVNSFYEITISNGVWTHSGTLFGATSPTGNWIDLTNYTLIDTGNYTSYPPTANSGIVSNTSGVFVNANTGIVANSTGTFVNATYIGTLSANNASFLGGTAAASYQLNSTLNANIASYLPSYTGVVNGSSHTVGTSFIANATGVYTGVVNATTISTGSVNVINASGLTTTANVNIGAAGELIMTAGAGMYANGGLGSAGEVLHSNGSSVYWATDDQGVTSVSGTGTVSGLTLSGTVTSTGSLTLGGTLSASVIDNMTDEFRLFNNMGDNHATRTAFDATSPSYNFGWRFVQGSTNGPGVNGAAQYYSEYVGLGNDYLATGATSYGMQIAYPRNVTTPYIAIRYNENNSLGAWQKISAGFADTANNASFLGGTAAASYQLNSTLNANIASYLPTYTGVVNGASHTVGSSFIANATGVYHTGTVNAASHTVGTSTVANATGVYTGIVNATTISTGSVNVINASGLTTTANVSIGAAGDLIVTAGAGISANGGFGTAGQVLTSNASSIYWSTITSGATLNANNTETGTFYFGMANTTSGTWSNAVVSTTKISFVPNTGALTVNGSISATTKSFLIDHPTKSGMKLRYASLEGPENGVYIRGKIHGYIIDLPDYWTGLVDEDTITVQLTAIGEPQTLYVVEVSDNQVFINSNEGVPYCYYTVYGERKDVDKLIVEY